MTLDEQLDHAWDEVFGEAYREAEDAIARVLRGKQMSVSLYLSPWRMETFSAAEIHTELINADDSDIHRLWGCAIDGGPGAIAELIKLADEHIKHALEAHAEVIANQTIATRRREITGHQRVVAFG